MGGPGRVVARSGNARELVQPRPPKRPRMLSSAGHGPRQKRMRVCAAPPGRWWVRDGVHARGYPGCEVNAGAGSS